MSKQAAPDEVFDLYIKLRPYPAGFSVAEPREGRLGIGEIVEPRLEGISFVTLKDDERGASID